MGDLHVAEEEQTHTAGKHSLSNSETVGHGVSRLTGP